MVFSMRRTPAVAGQFYSASAQGLYEEVVRYSTPAGSPIPFPILISPHAGLMFSGPVAGAVYSCVAIPETVILVGPNHTGQGPVLSIYPEGSWSIPGAEVSIDSSLAQTILSRIPFAEGEESAHKGEHCLEVQLPFLWYHRQDLRIVPMVLGTTDLSRCEDIGMALADIIKGQTRTDPSSAPPLLAITTDMTHYEPDDVTRRKDALAIEAIQHGDPEQLAHTVHTHRISMCGLGPTLVALSAARQLQALSPTLIRYATSGEVSGDLDRVVGYAGFTFSNSSSSRGNH